MCLRSMALATCSQVFLRTRKSKASGASSNLLTSAQPPRSLADRATTPPSAYRADLTSFLDECFGRAVNFRVRRLPAAQLAEEPKLAEADGYVLIPPVRKALSKCASSEPSMSLYFP